MKLTLALLRIKNPGGHIFRGKYRLVRKVTDVDLVQTTKAFKIEEQNMVYLKNPYLTEEQVYGMSKSLQKPQIRIKNLKLQQLKDKCQPHITVEDRLGFLRNLDRWE